VKIVVVGGSGLIGSKVVAKLFGYEVAERTLIPGANAQLGATRFDDWLSMTVAA
jgi:hypothetical protein